MDLNLEDYNRVLFNHWNETLVRDKKKLILCIGTGPDGKMGLVADPDLSKEELKNLFRSLLLQLDGGFKIVT